MEIVFLIILDTLIVIPSIAVIISMKKELAINHHNLFYVLKELI